MYLVVASDHLTVADLPTQTIIIYPLIKILYPVLADLLTQTVGGLVGVYRHVHDGHVEVTQGRPRTRNLPSCAPFTLLLHLSCRGEYLEINMGQKIGFTSCY